MNDGIWLLIIPVGLLLLFWGASVSVQQGGVAVPQAPQSSHTSREQAISENNIESNDEVDGDEMNDAAGATDVPEEVSTISPYAKFVTFSTSAARSTDPTREYVTISFSSRAEDAVVLTGWTIASTETGKGVTIGRGVSLPQYQQTQSESAIVLEPGGRAIVTTGRSPIGFSFRPNLCTGYFAQSTRFTPSISRSCPRIKDGEFPEKPNQLSDACLDFIDRIPRCSVPDPLPLNLAGACDNYVRDHAHYGACVRDHRASEDFFSNEWRIYAGRTEELWKAKREAIVLYDSDGLIIAERTY